MYNIFVVGRGPQIYQNIGLVMGVTIVGDAAKSGKNTHLLVIIRVRQSQKISLLKFTNRNLFKKETARNNLQKLCVITSEFISCYIYHLSTTRKQISTS